MSNPGKRAKRKGAEFERKVCKLFSDWWGMPFRRVPLSGGWQKDMLTGDVSLVGSDDERERFPFSIECKCAESWTFDALMHGKCAYLKKSWFQCTKDAEKAHKIPLLVFSRSRIDVWCMFKAADIFDVIATRPTQRLAMMRAYHIIIPGPGIICLLKDMLKIVSVKTWKEVKTITDKEVLDVNEQTDADT